jgi:hypothetical protein
MLIRSLIVIVITINLSTSAWASIKICKNSLLKEATVAFQNIVIMVAMDAEHDALSSIRAAKAMELSAPLVDYHFL